MSYRSFSNRIGVLLGAISKTKSLSILTHLVNHSVEKLSKFSEFLFEVCHILTLLIHISPENQHTYFESAVIRLFNFLCHLKNVFQTKKVCVKP